MSEFKFACPVCGQHIKCDSSQAGSVMDCPTCFQKINVPQAPAGEGQKFILTGTQVTDKPVFNRGAENAPTVTANKFPGAAAVVLILLFVGAAAATIYWATIIRPHHAAGHGSQPTNAPVASQPKPGPVAPKASDANWTLSLESNAIPETVVEGRIHGKDFIMERAALQNGSLTLRYGTKGAVELGAIINLSGAQPEELTVILAAFTTNAEKAAKITLRWKDDSGTVQKPAFESGYALRLEFGMLLNNHLPGKIYLCLPDDEKSYLMGSFVANIVKPKPKPEQKPKQ